MTLTGEGVGFGRGIGGFWPPLTDEENTHGTKIKRVENSRRFIWGPPGITDEANFLRDCAFPLKSTRKHALASRLRGVVPWITF